MSEYIIDLNAFDGETLDDGLREEIVRCGDCEYQGNPRKCWLGETKSDEFCSRGKRKECGDE